MVESVVGDSTEFVARDLMPGEWHRLSSLQGEMDWSNLRPYNSAVIVCELGGEIVGVGSLHLIPHFEPVWVRPDKRGRGVLQSLIAFVKKRYRGLGVVASTTTDERVAKLMRVYGMTELEGGRIFKVEV